MVPDFTMNTPIVPTGWNESVLHMGGECLGVLVFCSLACTLRTSPTLS